MTKTASRCSPEVRARAVRTVPEHQADRPSQWAAISSIAGKFGCTAETLRNRVRQAERDAGERPGLTSDERARLKALERENRELRQADGILRKASASFARAELDRRSRKRGCPSTRIVMNTGSNRAVLTWTEHRDINEVMLATALLNAYTGTALSWGD